MKALEPTVGTLLVAIRAKCWNCSGNSRREVDGCLLKDCPLYPYRSVDALGKIKQKKLPLNGQIDLFGL